MPNQDCAILVGIKHYADKAFPGLNGPVHDVELMKNWLVSPAGGNLDASSVRTIQSPDPPPNVPPSQMPPLSANFLNEFQSLVLDQNNQPIPRQESRLYLYFSGHGFSQIRDQMPRASLYTANANRIFCDSIPGTFYAYWTKDAALFRDIVIIMDCCRDAEFAKNEAVPAILQISNLGAQKLVAVFGIYAAPKGGKAQERPIPSRGNKVHGLLTHAVIDALENAPPNASGVVTSDEVCGHIRERWASICGNVPAEPPEFSQPGTGPIALVTRAGDLISQRLGVGAWTAGEQVELIDGRLAPLAQLRRSADGATVTVTWVSRPPQDVPVTAGVTAIGLTAGFYLLKRGAARKQFLAGEDNVDI